jgi:hypothetical protein
MTNKINGEISLVEYDEFMENIQNYINSSNIIFSNYKDDYKKYADLTEQEIQELNRQDLLSASMLLLQYSAFLQDEYNKHKIVLDWSEQAINKIIFDSIESGVVNKEDESFKYAKAEIKRSIILKKVGEIGLKIELAKSLASAKIGLLEGKVQHLKKMSEIFFEKARYRQ